jgi:hypothetical protein
MHTKAVPPRTTASLWTRWLRPPLAKTRASLQLNGSDKDLSGPGHGAGLSLAWDSRGKPIAGINSPLAVFHRLFSAEQVPLDQLRLRMTQKRSLLDAVMVEAQDLQRGLAKNDVEKLDEYFQGIREIELRIAKEE